MPQSDLLKSLAAGETPQKVRRLIAAGMVPLPAGETLELLVHLLKDPDPEIARRASLTLSAWDEEEIIVQLENRDCSYALAEHYAAAQCPPRVLLAIIANPSAPGAVINSLAQKVPAKLLESILDNRSRILESPGILDSVRRNPNATPEILRLAREIESEFLGDKKSTYSIDKADEVSVSDPQPSELELGPPLQDFSLEGLPVDEQERQAAISHRLSSMPVKEKIRYALFGNREVRAVLVRDTNKEIARTVLRSPKITGNEIESIASMRSVAEDILREIGNNREWTKSYAVVQNLIKNPKTPPIVSQRLLFRLRKQDLMYLTHDRSISDAVRHGATRLLKQRTAGRQSP